MAEAIKLNCTSLESLDKALALWDAGRSKALRTIQFSFAKRPREISQEIIEKEGLPTSGQEAAE